ncbi:MAG: hypothetical protein ACJ79W_20810 [Myxococcales bacterium]
MRWLKVAIATVVALCTYACGEGAPSATAPGAAAARRGSSTIGMFLSRSSALSSKDGDELGKACAADVKKACGSVEPGDNYVRRLTYCLRSSQHDLSDKCKVAINKMRHEKHGDDACAGACACGQTCVGDDDDHDKDGKGNRGKSLSAVAAGTASHDARNDGDHDDDDLRCAGACPAGMVDCHGKCVDVDNDPLNCGYCDNECPGKLGDPCVKRQCEKACKGQPGLVDCGEVCADVKNDLNNCGSCGLACGCNQVCTNGQCVAAAQCTPDGDPCTSNAECCTGTCAFDPVTLGLVCGGVG